MNRVIFSIIAALCLISCGSNGRSAAGKTAESEPGLDSVLVSLRQIDSSARANIKANGTDDMVQDCEKSWSTFYNLCMDKKFNDALDFLFSPYKNGDIADQCLTFLLPYSDIRYAFLVSVIRPMMNELRDESFASEHYIELLRADKDMEDTLIKIDYEYNEDHGARVPSVYPIVVMDLGYSLGKAGHIGEALALSGDLYTALEYLANDSWKAAVQTAKYRSRLHLMAGDNDGAMEEWEVLEKFLNENKEDFTAAQLDDLRKELDKARQLTQ